MKVMAVGAEDGRRLTQRRAKARAVSRTGRANMTMAARNHLACSWASEDDQAAQAKPRNMLPASPMKMEAGLKL